MCFFLLLDSPSRSTSWLTPREIQFLELRQIANSIDASPQSSDPDTPETETKRKTNYPAITSVLTDWKVYLLILGSWSNAVPNYAMKFTMPQIITGMGFEAARAQLLTIPPYALGAFSAYIFSVFADRYSWRMPFIVVPQVAQVVAFAVLFTHAESIEENVAVCYFGVCLACFGCVFSSFYLSFFLNLFVSVINQVDRMYPILPGVNAWNVSNTPDPTRRAISIGYLICMGNVGGLIGSFIYREDEAPRYVTGYGNSFAFASAGIVACFLLEFILFRVNRQREGMSEVDVRERYSDEELRAMGEKSPLFRYTL